MLCGIMVWCVASHRLESALVLDVDADDACDELSACVADLTTAVRGSRLVLDGDAKFVRRGNLLSEWVKAVPKLVPRAVASVDVRSKHASQCLSVHTAVSRHRCIAWGTCAGLGESAKTKGQANLQGISEGGEGSAPGNRSGMLLPSISSTHCLLDLQPWA